ncbi:MAG: LytTR family transcriptional regulator [Algoriphagus sp.]|nr:LytTR family transcriptional regulator [Algoriphagus sp.]
MKELLELKKTNGNGKSEKKNLFQHPRLLVKDAVFVRHEGNLVKVKFDDILWLKGDGNYTTLITKKAVFFIRNILKDFESVLPTNQFLRIHKSYIVQVSEILSINTKEVIVGTDLIPVGRTFYHQLLSGIRKIGSLGD